MKEIYELRNELTIREHFKVLGKTFLTMFILLMVLSILAFTFSDSIFTLMANYYSIDKSNIVTLTPFEQMNTQIFMALSLSTIVLIPLLVFNIYSFIKPALSKKYADKIKKSILVVGILGVIGFAFGTLVLSKMTLTFLLNYQTFNAMWSLSSIVKSVLVMGLSGALVLQIAPVMTMLNKIGIINPRRIGRYRLWVALGLAIFAGIITIGTDVVSQIVLFIPSYLSFEAGLFFANRHNNQLNKMEVKQNVRI